MNNKHIKAFTLAEVLIVLIVIGIITAITVPIAMNNLPDEKVLKFKKGNATLHSAIKNLIRSDKYYKDGDFGIKANGTQIKGSTDDEKRYFCNTFADVVSTKSKNCSIYDEGYNSTVGIYLENMISSKTWGDNDASEYVDKICNSYTNTGAEIVSADNITYYTVNPAYTFGSTISSGGTDTNARIFSLKKNNYKYLCMDIDGIGTGLPAFGYGIRADGKILVGKLAQTWMKWGFNEESAPSTIDSVTAVSATFPVICDDGYAKD